MSYLHHGVQIMKNSIFFAITMLSLMFAPTSHADKKYDIKLKLKPGATYTMKLHRILKSSTTPGGDTYLNNANTKRYVVDKVDSKENMRLSVYTVSASSKKEPLESLVPSKSDYMAVVAKITLSPLGEFSHITGYKNIID